MGGPAEFGELHSAGAFAQGPWEGLVEGDVLEEKFPLGFEGVVAFAGRDFIPASVVIDGAIDVRVPDGDGGVLHGLGPAFAEADDGGAFGAVDLHDEEVVAADAHVPRGVELAEDAGVGLEHGVGGVVGSALVGLAVFADALGNVGGGVAHHFGDFSKEVVDDVAPVTVHVDDDAAAVFFAVIP